MSKKNLIAVSVLCLVVLGVLFSLSSNPVKLGDPAPLSQGSEVIPTEMVVTLSDSGFSPKSLTISVGNAVRFINQSSDEKASVNSDDYPTNKKYPELNLGVFQKGSSLVHIFTTIGTYTYHDQFQPEHTGTIIVQ